MDNSDLVDTRPLIEPEFFAYRELPAEPGSLQALCREASAALHKDGGATFFRFTLASPEYPKPPYPDGLYVEGWKVDPAHMDPPGKQAPFNFPVTAPPSGGLSDG